jgi:Skp family chaperone for outer membrane proteins
MVSKLKLTILAFAVIGMVSIFSTKSAAQKIGVIDQQKVLEVFPDYQAAQAKIQGIIKGWQDTLKMMTDAAQAKFDGYQKIKETMSKEALAKADSELSKMQRDIQNYNNVKTNQQNGEILKVQNDNLKPVSDKLREVVGSVAKKKKLDLILDKNSQLTVAYVGDNVTDITTDVQAAVKK